MGCGDKPPTREWSFPYRRNFSVKRFFSETTCLTQMLKLNAHSQPAPLFKLPNLNCFQILRHRRLPGKLVCSRSLQPLSRSRLTVDQVGLLRRALQSS